MTTDSTETEPLPVAVSPAAALPSAEMALLAAVGHTTATPIQAAAMGLLAAGGSVHALAETGSGKTLAFLIPLLLRLDTDVAATQLLVLAPTRELGLQIAQVAERLAGHMQNLENWTKKPPLVRTAFGGQKMETQRTEIEKAPHVLVATPGRALDLLRREVLSLQGLGALVLDEADVMLAMGFAPQVAALCEDVPRGVQTALFSATESTLTGELEERLSRGAHHVDVRAVTKEGGVDKADFARHEAFRYLDNNEKHRQLAVCLRSLGADMKSGLLFCETRENVQNTAAYLRREGFSVQALSGELGQIERTSVLRHFKAGGVRFLVATNIAARGIDVSELSVVVNVDLPPTQEEYVHRAGRTGRAGKAARVINMCTTTGEGFLRRILTGFPVTLVRYVAQAPAATAAAPLHGESAAGENAADETAAGETNDSGPHDDNVSVEAVSFRRLHINRGKSDKVRPGDVLGALTKEAGLAAKDVGSIFIFDHFTHVDVNASRADAVLAHLARGRIKNLSVKASEALV